MSLGYIRIIYRIMSISYMRNTVEEKLIDINFLPCIAVNKLT